MTSNQIAYANYMESVRHNKRTERLSSRNIDVAESQIGLGYANLAEMYRHNYSTEQLTEQQTGVRQQEAETKQSEAETRQYEAKTKRMQLYSQWLPDWMVAAGYGINELMESTSGEVINYASEHVAENVHSNPNRKHRKR